MRIIHCADIHLDSQMTANLDKVKAKERKHEILDTFLRMIKYAGEITLMQLLSLAICSIQRHFLQGRVIVL